MKASVEEGRVAAARLLGEGDDRALTPDEVRMIEARDVAIKSPETPCAAAPFNTVVLPPQDDGSIAVYLLTPQIERNVYPAGGHFRIDIGPDGGRTSSRRFTKGCIALDTAQAGQGDPAALVLTHLLDSHPTEIHVFLSLWMDKPIYVMADGQAWVVEGSRIRMVGDGGN